MHRCTAPEVTVLMSCYNANRWLHEAIDSVLKQTFEDFEFIIIDDGSSDNTWRIIQDYRAKDERIVAISKKNTGLADSLNVGIAQARGIWIARLDADDLCEPTRLEEQAKFVHNYPGIVLLGTGFIEIDGRGSFIKKNFYPSGHKKLVRHLKRSQRFFPHSSAFYRVGIVKQVGGYNRRILRSEDRRLWLELSLRGRIACLPRPLVKVRKHESQISCDKNGKQQFCDGTAATVCHFLREAGYIDPARDGTEEEWEEFYKWIELRVENCGALERRNAWTRARIEYFSDRRKLLGALQSLIYLLNYEHLPILIWEKLVGSSMPSRLAKEWVARKGN